MTKSRKRLTTIKVHDLLPPSFLSEKDNKRLADALLAMIRERKEIIDKITERGNAEMQAVTNRYKAEQEPVAADLHACEKLLIVLMKKKRREFFDGTDVLQLQNGALIHEEGDHVTIPRDALTTCELLGFDDVIKVIKSLDREAIEKWSTEKLLLIGAERKPVESFSYDLKKGDQ